MALSFALIAFGVLVGAALLGAEGRRPLLFAVAKPAATLSLLLVTGLPGDDRFGGLIAAGLAFSALGDAALLSERQEAFLTGVLLFLVAHVGYTAAFVAGGKAGPLLSPALVGFAALGPGAVWLLGRLLPGLHGAMRGAILVYGAAITAMVGSSFFVLAGPWPERVGVAAVAGAVLFFIGDALLAWSRFRAPFPHSQSANLAFYWSGQLGIALAARWGTGG